MKFRPCIDLHQGIVKQIVGSSLSDSGSDALATNFVSERPAAWFAELYKNDGLDGGHVIRLGPGNDEAAREAISAWSGGFQLGGSINASNAIKWLEFGAAKVIVTSYVFSKGMADQDRLKSLANLIGKEKLVLDLSCRFKDGRYWIVTDRWQKFTKVDISPSNLDYFADYCSEFLIHGVDVEGKQSGIETELVRLLGGWAKIPITYAGGVGSWDDIRLINELGYSKIDFTVGSALDIFGGARLKYRDIVEKNTLNFMKL